MTLTKRIKTAAIKKTRKHDKDTGSAQVQVSVLSKQIDKLAAHLKKNHKDNHSRKGILQMVADRRKHLKYLEKKDSKAYTALIKALGLKK
jgi:small subunit ribosomal protein S15